MVTALLLAKVTSNHISSNNSGCHVLFLSIRHLQCKNHVNALICPTIHMWIKQFSISYICGHRLPLNAAQGQPQCSTQREQLPRFLAVASSGVGDHRMRWIMTRLGVLHIPYSFRVVQGMNSMKLVIRYILISWKKTPNDAVTPQCQSQLTPKMKANAVPRLLSSLVWIDQYNECNGMTTFMQFMPYSKSDTNNV